jgi:hypothetical protein
VQSSTENKTNIIKKKIWILFMGLSDGRTKNITFQCFSNVEKLKEQKILYYKDRFEPDIGNPEYDSYYGKVTKWAGVEDIMKYYDQYYDINFKEVEIDDKLRDLIVN